MDDGMDMDDLFGDAADLSLPTRPPPSKELHQRVDELRGGGCCQTVAWSNWGCIATISANGAALELRNLRCHPGTGNWGLSEPTITPAFTANLDGGPLKHLSWSPTGSELAVIDCAGRVTILAIFSSLNKPTLHRPCTGDPVDDLYGVVGCYWLNLAPYPPNRPAFLNGPAVKDGSIYRYEASQAPVFGPFHPSHTKSALVCVTTNGILRVLWPQNNGKYYESHTELESIVSSDDLITHAAICPDKSNTLLIAFATTSKQLRTVRALVDWGVPKTNEKVPPGAMLLNPTIKTRHLTVTSWLHDTSGETLNASSMESSMAQLSHLEFLPSCGGASGRITPATIVAIRSHLPVSMTHYNQDVHTTVDRWEIRDKPQSVHPAFEQLSSRRNSVGSQPPSTVFLKKLDSFTVNKIALTMQPMNLGKVLFFAYSDSSVDYRDRTTMAETFTDQDLDRVCHLSQIGFSYTEDEPCLQVALSPSYCSVVQIRNDGKIKWKQLEYHLGDIGSSMEDSQYSAVVAALALSCSTAVMRNVTYDDLLATAHKYVKLNFAYDWLIELSKILKAQMDYSEEQHYDVLIRNTTIQLCLCIQNSLGFQGEFNARTFSGKFAWLVLQLRNIVVLVTMAANLTVSGANPNDKTSPLEDPEVINALAGSVRWVLDFLAWLTDTLLTLPTTLPSSTDLTKADGFSLPELYAHLRSTNTISLHLLLSSPTRGFLTAICRRLSHLDYIARKAMVHGSTNTNTPQQPNNSASPALSPALRSAYMQIATLTNNTIIRAKTMETLLSSLTSLIKNTYTNNNPPYSGSPQAEKARNTLEIKMLFCGQFPEAFKVVIAELFRKEGLLAGVRSEIEPAKLFFADFALLEVDEDAVSVAKRKAQKSTIDCFRKGWLANPRKGEEGRRWRRCARCAAVMEDVLTERRALQWLVMQTRRCYCSGYWNTLAPGEMIA
ncbi:Mediator of RNA polymerase II transcription subunit 16 [Lachnellula arida]|uniref:Mediator of RNA polymerase II transcription subunit 16 n=1 Tax=Lachnellula arida TaxID=1316785 RepID=A0A8T9B893_9HELO|nr:Mediator of RNA polymerase II transcription subunit 16 [Lachnellula arida]